MSLFSIPKEITDYLAILDQFIADEIVPLQQIDDNERFFDHRREWARTDFENGGTPRKEWEDLLRQMRRKADAAGHLRFGLPVEFGGKDGSNLAMAVIREHLATKGLGLHNDLQNESSIVANNPTVLMMRDFGTEQQKDHFLTGMMNGTVRFAFGLTEPEHGSDVTWMDTTAVPQMKDGVNGYLINGAKMWNTGVHVATHDMIFCRTSGEKGQGTGISCLLVPLNSPGFIIEEYMWTFNMPSDHARVTLDNIWVPEDALFGPKDHGLSIALHFVHENRIRQAASSLGAAQFCINESVHYATERKPYGKPLYLNQAIQFPLVELNTEAAMLRGLIHSTAYQMDQMSKVEVQKNLSAQVSMCNYRANRLVCNASDQAIQTHGGMGYSRHKPFEHIYRHHRRYRITEGSEEIQMRNIGRHMFNVGKREL